MPVPLRSSSSETRRGNRASRDNSKCQDGPLRLCRQGDGPTVLPIEANRLSVRSIWMAFSVHTGPHVQPRDCRIRNPVSEKYRAGLRRPRGAVGRTLRRGRPARSHQSDAPQYLGARCATADDVHCQGARRNGRSHLLWTKHPGPIAHSAMMLFARITSPRRRASSLMKAAVRPAFCRPARHRARGSAVAHRAS